MTVEKALNELKETCEVLIADQTGDVLREINKLLTSIKKDYDITQKHLTVVSYDRDEARRFVEKVGLTPDLNSYIDGELDGSRINQIKKAIEDIK